MGFLSKTLGKIFGDDTGPREFGGGFDPAIRPYMEQGLKGLQSGYEDPRFFEGPRVAGFDPAQLQAQASLLGLSTADPDYFRTATEGLGEAIDLQRQAAAGITPEAIAAQREILAPTAEIERRAARRGLEEALTGIGVGAAGAGVGALEGGRADVLRGVAGGEFATTLAGIEGGLTERAIAGAEAQRAREAAGAAGLAGLTTQQLGIGQEQTAAERARAELAMGVGEQRRQLAQQQIGVQREIFEEQDPFKRSQQYLSTLYGAPTGARQFYQEPSTFQEILGIASTFSGGKGSGGGGGGGLPPGVAQEGGSVKSAKINYKATGGPLVMLTNAFNKEEEEKDNGDIVLSDGTRISAQTLADVDEADKPLPAEGPGPNTESKEEVTKPKEALSRLGNTYYGGNDPNLAARQTAARSQLARMVGRQEGGEVVDQGPPSILDRVIGGAKKAYQFYREDLDPFRNYTDEQRRRIGLSILAATPEVGETPLAVVSRGALAGIEQVEADELAAAKQRAARRKLELEAKEDPFMVEPAQLNALRSSVAQKLGFVFDFDANEFKTSSGENLTASQAAEASNLLTDSAITLRDSKDLVEAQKVISSYN